MADQEKPVRRPSSRSRSKVAARVAAASGAALAAAAIPTDAAAATFTVTTLADSGAGSLRQATVDANTTPGPDVITFQSGLTGTIALTTGELQLTDSVDVQGPGEEVISVSGSDQSRVFYIYSSALAPFDVSISDLTVTAGLAKVGGGIAVLDENLTLTDVTISESRAVDMVVPQSGPVKPMEAPNGGGEGGGLFATGGAMTLSLTNVTVTGNTTNGSGGGIYIGQLTTPLQISNSLIDGNQADQHGGGIYFFSPSAVTVVDTTISANVCSGVGGGVSLYDTDAGPILFDRTTISGNSAEAGGGAFFYAPDDQIIFRNTTVSGNIADAVGGGVFLTLSYTYTALGSTTKIKPSATSDAPFFFEFSTIVGNAATAGGGGIFNYAYRAELRNTIVADNAAGADSDLSGNFEANFSLIESPESATISGGNNIIGVDPQLGPLADNGGPTLTHLPDAASPVINAGEQTDAPPTDQRGLPRVVGGEADIGAVEVNGGTIQFDPVTYTVNENGTSATLTVTRTGGLDPASVDYATANGTAASGADFTATSGTLNFALGQTSATIIVPILDDNLAEGDETFTATLSKPTIATTIGAAPTATVTITDIEPGVVQFDLPSYAVAENGGTATINVVRTNGSTGTVTVNYTTTSGTATAGADFTTTSGTLTWLPGDTAPKSISVPILDDNFVEGQENFTATLSAPTGGAVIGPQGTTQVTINDFEAGTVQIAPPAQTVAETAGTATLTVTRTGGSSGPLTVSYATANGTATAGQDYTATSGSVTFNDGDTAPKTITIPIIDDATPEVPELFTVNLSNPTAGTIGAPASASVTIDMNDGEIPTFDTFAKLMLAAAAALIGLFAIGRGKLFGMLLAVLLVGSASSSIFAAEVPGQHRTPRHAHAKVKPPAPENAGRLHGTIVSITRSEGNATLTITGHPAISLPARQFKVVDRRAGKFSVKTLDALAANQKVRVRFIRDKKGELRFARVRIDS